MKNTINKAAFILSLLGCLLFAAQGKCQVLAAKNQLTEIYKSYDSLKYLTFDVAYNYDTDTLYGDFTHDQLKGQYTMNGKQAFYKLGDIDFMQNESYLIAVYHKDKFMIVGDPQKANAGGYLPMRAQLDSMFSLAASQYSVSLSYAPSVTDTATIGSVIFTPTDSTAKFTSYKITFDSNRHLLRSLEYSFKGLPDNASAYQNLADSLRNSLLNVPRNKTLRIKFTNYRFGNLAAEIYNQNSYIFFEDEVCKPVSKYADFKIYYAARNRR